MASHTATNEWKSFEIRMRQRRAERLVRHATDAVGHGRLEEARGCLAEARGLAPALSSIAEVERRLNAPPIVRNPRRFGLVAVLAACPVAGALVVAIVTLMGSPPIGPVDDLRDIQIGFRPSDTRMTPTIEPVADLSDDATPLQVDQQADTRVVEPDDSASMLPISTAASVKTDRSTESFPPTTGAVAIAAAAEPAPAPSTPAVPPAPAPIARMPAPASASTAPIPTSATADDITRVATAIDRLPESPIVRPSAPKVATDDVAVRDVLDRYAAAYTALDAGAAQRVFPSVNRAALARAFGDLASQRLSLGECRIDVAGSSARANCTGSTTWAPRIGDGTPRSEARRWTFDLTRAGDDWQIANARVQNR